MRVRWSACNSAIRSDERRAELNFVPSPSALGAHPSDRHRLAPAFMNPSTNSSGILNGRFITHPSLSELDASFPVPGSLYLAPLSLVLAMHLPCPADCMASSESGADGRTFPDPVDV